MATYRVMSLRLRRGRLAWEQLYEGTRYACEKFAKAETERARESLRAIGMSVPPAVHYVTRRTAEDFRKYHGKLHWGTCSGRSVGTRGE